MDLEATEAAAVERVPSADSELCRDVYILHKAALEAIAVEADAVLERQEATLGDMPWATDLWDRMRNATQYPLLPFQQGCAHVAATAQRTPEARARAQTQAQIEVAHLLGWSLDNVNACTKGTLRCKKREQVGHQQQPANLRDTQWHLTNAALALHGFDNLLEEYLLSARPYWTRESRRPWEEAVAALPPESFSRERQVIIENRIREQAGGFGCPKPEKVKDTNVCVTVQDQIAALCAYYARRIESQMPPPPFRFDMLLRVIQDVPQAFARKCALVQAAGAERLAGGYRRSRSRSPRRANRASPKFKIAR
jgi:hypothetical protein